MQGAYIDMHILPCPAEKVLSAALVNSTNSHEHLTSRSKPWSFLKPANTHKFPCVVLVINPTEARTRQALNNLTTSHTHKIKHDRSIQEIKTVSYSNDRSVAVTSGTQVELCARCKYQGTGLGKDFVPAVSCKPYKIWCTFDVLLVRTLPN